MTICCAMPHTYAHIYKRKYVCMCMCVYFLAISLIATLLKDAYINFATALCMCVSMCVCVLCSTNSSVPFPNHSHEKSAQTAKSHVPLLYGSMVTDLFDLLMALSFGMVTLPAISMCTRQAIAMKVSYH